MTEVEAIRARHSVRNYLDRAIEGDKLSELNACIEDCNRRGGLHLQLLLEAGGTFRKLLSRAMGLGSAPSVIACVGTNAPDLEERVGYYGERVVLRAQQLGLNTCWAGTFNPQGVPVALAPGERLAIVIALGYGSNPGKPHRSKPIEQLIRVDGPIPEWFRMGAELAQLAPTAINQQKFRLTLSLDGIASAEDLRGPFSRVDLGIVRCHFDIGARSVLGEAAPPIR